MIRKERSGLRIIVPAAPPPDALSRYADFAHQTVLQNPQTQTEVWSGTSQSRRDDYPQWGNFFLNTQQKMGKVIVYFTHIFITFALMIYKVIK